MAFGKQNSSNRAKQLTRGPLGIVGMLLLLVESLAAAVLTFGQNLSATERMCLVIFVCIFPLIVLAVFYRLVSRYPGNIYPPSDYKDEKNFVEALNREIAEFREVATYQDMDGLYLELQKLAIAYPDFVEISKTTEYKRHFSGEMLLRYETYANISWNICETIYDRQGNDLLFRTWLPVVKVENRLHRRWFDCEENHIRFKKEFRDYITSHTELFPVTEKTL